MTKDTEYKLVSQFSTQLRVTSHSDKHLASFDRNAAKKHENLHVEGPLLLPSVNKSTETAA